MADINTATLPPLDPDAAKAAQAVSDKAALVNAFSLKNPLMAAGMDMATLVGRGLGGAYNTAARLPNAFGANLPTISDTSPFFGGNSASMTPYFDRLRTPDQQVPAAPTPVATPAAAATPAPAAATPAPAAATPAPQSNWEKAMAYAQQAPTTEQQGTRLALAMHALSADTVANASRISAETGKSAALLLPHEISQEQELDPITGMATRNRNIYGTYDPNLKIWNPIKLPTIEPAKPTLAQFVAKNAPLNPKLDQKGLAAKYAELYPDQ